MAKTSTVSKVKLKEGNNTDYSIFQIKDIVAREQKLDKNNSIGEGYIAFNNGNISPGSNSVSLGYRNNAAGNTSVALGNGNTADGNYSTAIGVGNKTIAPYQTVLGKYNKPLNEDLFEIGCGTDNDARANIFRITKDGRLYIQKDILYGSTIDLDKPISLIEKIKEVENKIIQQEYELPKATPSALGGVMIGKNINIDENGTISVTFPDQSLYELPKADKETLGGIKIGNNLNIDKDGVVSVEIPEIPEEYELPVATATTLGGIKVSAAAGFRLNDGVLNFVSPKMDKDNPEGTGTFSMNTSGEKGSFSVSLGRDNHATGADSIALGFDNTSSNNFSISIGAENNSTGENSFAIGLDNDSTGESSFTIGKQNSSNGNLSFSIGEGIIVNYDNQIALGTYNENLEDNIFEIGNGSAGERKNALFIKDNGDIYIPTNIFINKTINEETGEIKYKDVFNALEALESKPEYTLPIASNTTLGGVKIGKNLSIDADGVLNAADVLNVFEDIDCKGSFSHNRVDTENIGRKSFASNSSALEYYSTAFGVNTQAGGSFTRITQEWNEETQEYIDVEEEVKSGIGSFSEGNQTKALGDYSHAAGNFTEAKGYSQFVIGSYNNNNENNLFEVGNGADENNRSNAFSIGRDGNVSIAGELTAKGQKIAPSVEIETQQEYDNLLLEDKMKDIVYLIKENNKLYYKDKNYGGGGSAEDVKILTRTDDFIPTEIENTYSGWIEDQEGVKISPNTLLESVQDKDGKNLEYILNNLEAKNIIYDDKTTLFNTTNVQNAIEIVDARAKNHSLIAPAFVPGQIYNIGDYVTYNNKLYKSKVNTQASVYKLPIVDASGSGNGRYYYSLGASSGTYTKYTSDDAYGGWFKNAIFICSKISEGVTLRRDWDGMKYYAYQDTFVYNGEIWYAILFNVGLPNVETNYPFKRIIELENFDIDVSKNIPTQELVTTFLDLATGNSFDPTAWEEVTVISEIKDEAKEILYDDTESQLGVNNVQEAIEWLKNYLNVFIPEDTEVIKDVAIEVLKTETLLSKTTISTSSGYATNSVTFLNNLSNYDSVDFKVYYNDNYILTNYKPTDIIGKSISVPGPENNSMKMNVTDTGASGFDCYYNMSLEIIGYRKE